MEIVPTELSDIIEQPTIDLNKILESMFEHANYLCKELDDMNNYWEQSAFVSIPDGAKENIDSLSVSRYSGPYEDSRFYQQTDRINVEFKKPVANQMIRLSIERCFHGKERMNMEYKIDTTIKGLDITPSVSGNVDFELFISKAEHVALIKNIYDIIVASRMQYDNTRVDLIFENDGDAIINAVKTFVKNRQQYANDKEKESIAVGIAYMLGTITPEEMSIKLNELANQNKGSEYRCFRMPSELINFILNHDIKFEERKPFVYENQLSNGQVDLFAILLQDKKEIVAKNPYMLEATNGKIRGG